MQRTTEQMVQWYRTHVTTSQIGFNPDGRCLQICRTARNIGAAFPSAVTAQNATPAEHRVHDVSKVKKGMVAYYDDPNDSNPFGHIVTVMGRRAGVNPDLLSSLVVRTNSVQSGRITVVAGDYFGKHWGDAFQFAATWLNGVALDMPDAPKPKPPTLPVEGKERLRKVLDILDVMIENQKGAGHERIVKALKRDKQAVKQTLDKWR